VTLLRIPGPVDPHVHLRDMEWAYKATVAQETAAALAAGYWAVLDMPNTPPATTTAARLRAKRELVASQARCSVGLFMGADQDADGSEYATAAADAIGLKLYCDHTTGDLLLDDQATRRRHLRAWAEATDKPVALHAEGGTLAEALKLLRDISVHAHVCHVSTAAELDMVRRSRDQGLRVSVGVTPHHLYLSEADTARLAGFARVKPPLRGRTDQAALWEGIADGTVDVIESDHAPHTRDEKVSSRPPYGLPGLETTIPLMVTALRDGRVTEDRLIALLATNAQRIFRLHPPADTVTLVDIDEGYVIRDEGLRAASGWSPFSEMPVWGRVIEVRIGGQVVFDGTDLGDTSGTAGLLS
jgi:dihydroorotase-like cyclic amidohydrolase